jgi:hypothetical protein
VIKSFLYLPYKQTKSGVSFFERYQHSVQVEVNELDSMRYEYRRQEGLQPDTSTTPLPMRYASMGYTSIGFPSMELWNYGTTSTKLFNFTVLIVLL